VVRSVVGHCGLRKYREVYASDRATLNPQNPLRLIFVQVIWS
jgi:hypothetical protein